MYTVLLKNSTLTADNSLIAQSQKRARNENTTLNPLFRERLNHYTSQLEAEERNDRLMEKLGHIVTNKIFSREEMNERR